MSNALSTIKHNPITIPRTKIERNFILFSCNFVTLISAARWHFCPGSPIQLSLIFLESRYPASSICWGQLVQTGISRRMGTSWIWSPEKSHIVLRKGAWHPEDVCYQSCSSCILTYCPAERFEASQPSPPGQWGVASHQDCWLWLCKKPAASGSGWDAVWFTHVYGSWNSAWQ